MGLVTHIDERPVRPFSNGTEMMSWYDNNCDQCKRSWQSKDGEYPSEKTMKQYVSIGKYCRLQYYLDLGQIEGTIPLDIAREIGVTQIDFYDHIKEHGFCELCQQCLKFSDRDDDRFHYPKRPRPNTPTQIENPNQLVMPFIIDEIGYVNEKEVENKKYGRQLIMLLVAK